MKLGTFTKTPVERKRYTLDYADWLDTGETISSWTFTVSPNTGTAPLEIDASATNAAANELIFFANFGDSGVTYVVDVLMTTSGGQTKEDQINFLVKAL